MIYVYRRPQSDSANTLSEALEACRIRSLGGRDFTRNDRIVCWGEHIDGGIAAKILNGKAPLRSKFTDVKLLKDAGVPTIDARTSPGTRGEWLARTSDHERGSDLLNPNTRADYYVRKEKIVKEFRVHSFNGLSIRAGEKIKSRPDAHPWIRSWDSGWDVRYNGVTPAHRTIAKNACKALKLDFGAVDIGQKDDGELIVLEVNRAPAMDEGNTAKIYAQYILEWFGQ